MNLLFVSNHYPPEVNAPATRLAEHTRVWAADGHGVDVLTAVPNFPEGKVYEGYRNRWTVEERGGATVHRVPVYLAPNRGTVRRGLAYLSFLVSAVGHARRIRSSPDVVVATSPQLLAGLAGWRVARRFGVRFVLEVRDLWPDSVVAVGALKDGPVVGLLRWLERFLYRRADHVVVVTDAFVEELVARGVPREKISVVKNGVDLSELPVPSTEERGRLRRELGLEDRFVASYVGTLGMAHRADVLLDAAELAATSEAPADDRLAFLLAGGGAQRDALVDRLRERDPGNVLLLEKRPRERALELVAASDVSVVHLRASELFTTVIPSKMFEAMALGRPVVLGVDGEAREIVEASGAGSFVRPEDPEALLRAVRRLRDDPGLRTRQGAAGPAFVREHFDRRVLARRYTGILRAVARDEPPSQGLEESRLLLTARTAVHLRPRQVAARVLRTARRLVGPPRLRIPAGTPELRAGVRRLAAPLADRLTREPFRPLLRRAGRLRDGTFEAVGECIPVEEVDWTGRPRSLLFTYHLHYFDDAPALALLAREGDGAAGARLRSLWESWLGACDGGGGDAWDPYPIASRIPNWIRALVLLESAPPSGTAGLRHRLLSSLWTQADRLRRTLEHDLGGNHLLRNRAALVWASAALDPPPLDLQRATGALVRELRRQVLDDGMHEERTPAYHALALRDALEVAEALGAVRAEPPPELLDVARRMRRALAQFVRPGDGGLHPFGDTTPHGPPPVAAVEGLAADVLGPAPTEPPAASGPWHLEEAGFAGVRSEAIEVVLDCGPFGARHQPGHGHCDGLSVVLSVRGTPVVVDPGIAGYADDPHRAWARSTAAHNTVQVDGREQTEIWGTFRAARRAGTGPAGVAGDREAARLFGALTPYHARNVVHEREVVVREAEVEIRDRVRGARGRRLDTRLHFAHGATVHDAGGGRWEVRCHGEAVGVEVTGVDAVRWETGLLFPGWGTVREGPVLHGWIDTGLRDVETFGFRLRLR